jgi:hypothetical protein
MALLPRRMGCTRGISAITLLLLATPLALAQGTPTRVPRADPLDPQARVPALTHASALAGYRRLGDDKPVPWKEANDTVTRIGGWRTYTRQAQQPDAPASAPTPAPAPAPAPAPGGQHKH